MSVTGAAEHDRADESSTRLRVRFAASLPAVDIEAAARFYAGLENVTLEQYPGFARVSGDTRAECFFLARREGVLVASARIVERRSRGFRVAGIEFGPLFADADAAVGALHALHDHYRQRRFALLTVGLGLREGPLTEGIRHRLGTSLTVRPAARTPRWSSVRLSLSPTPDELMRLMSKGHRSGIRKARREGLRVRRARGQDDIDGFTAVFCKMNAARGHVLDTSATATNLAETIAWLDRTGMGEMLVVEDAGGALIGGVVSVDQGSTTRYYKGAADPDVRHVGVLHPALFEAMQRARERGQAAYDLWGYNRHVDRKDPRYLINRFKKGFGGEVIDYPQPLDLPLGRRGALYLRLRNLTGRSR
ncbi:MAG: lipid II:glycine glycyltransferase FemX [Acidobacteriota bacterium]